MERTPHILFVSAFETSFIRADLSFFEARYTVTKGIGSGFLHLMRLLLDTAQSDIVFSWFASVYGACAVIWGTFLGKRTILQIGGVDLAKDERSGYGTWNSWWRSLIVGQALRVADHVLVVDRSLGDEARERAGYDGGNIEELPTRFSPEEWFPEGRKEPFVLTVAMVPDTARIWIKGIDTLLEAANRSPAVRFTIVGIQDHIAAGLNIPPNVTVYGRKPIDDVRVLMQKAMVYCQPSRREGLSNSLCEAMLCGCIPVATDAGGSRRAVGDTGQIVPTGDPVALANAVATAVSSDASLGLEARERIKTEFPEDLRWKRLRELIEASAVA